MGKNEVLVDADYAELSLCWEIQNWNLKQWLSLGNSAAQLLLPVLQAEDPAGLKASAPVMVSIN